MHLSTLKLTQFKNYDFAEVHFSPKVNCIVGLNGMGKTNLLDAIYYLCMCKSHFSVPDRMIVQHSLDFFRLEGQFDKDQKLVKVVAKVVPKDKKAIEVNGVAHKKLADHIGLLPIVMITPYDTDLALEGSEERRRFLNNSLSQIDPLYLHAELTYNRLLRQRNAALKSFGGRLVNPALLTTLEEQMLPLANLVHEKRKSFMASFLPIFQKYYTLIANEQEQVSCRYRSQLIDSDLKDLFLANREKDVILQRTTVGTHKDDLVFVIEDRPLKKFASQGQLKSYILALKLAQYEIVKKHKTCRPLLLLDDIFDKLDSNRVQQLIQLLFSEDFGQIFFTDTHEDRLMNLIKPFAVDARQLVVRDGNLVISH